MSELVVNARLYSETAETAIKLEKIIGFINGSLAWDDLPKNLRKAKTKKVKEIYLELGLSELEGKHIEGGLTVVSTFCRSSIDPLPFYKQLGKLDIVCTYLELCYDEFSFENIFLIGARSVKADNFIEKITDLDRQLALELAIDRNNIGQVKMLVDSNLDLDKKIVGKTILYHAFEFIDRTTVQDILLDFGANPNIANDDRAGYTPIFRVISYSSMDYSNYNERFLNSKFYLSLEKDTEGYCLERIKKLVKHGAHVNWRCRNGSTPLMLASREHRARICDFLIDAGADINSRDSKGMSALLHALDSGVRRERGAQYNAVRLLIDRGADPWIKNEEGQCALYLACGNLKIEQLLADCGLSYSNISYDVSEKDLSDKVRMLVRLNQIEVFSNPEFLADIFSDNNAKEELYRAVGEYGRSEILKIIGVSPYFECHRAMNHTLSKAAGSGGVDTVKLCLDFAQDLTAYTEDIGEALRVCAFNAEETCANRLLASGVTPKLVSHSRGHDVLYHAVLNFSPATISQYLALSDERQDAIEASFKRRNPEVFQVLAGSMSLFPEDYVIEFLTKLTQYLTDYLRDPLVHDDEERVAEICEKAFLNGANIEGINEDGQTPLIVAAKAGWSQIVGLLLAKRAEVNVQDNKKRSALSHAAGKGFLTCVEQLINAGADRHQKDARGFLPFSYAKAKKHQGIMELVRVE